MIQFAAIPDRGSGTVASSLRNAPAWAKAAVNRARRRVGLREIATPKAHDRRDDDRRVGVWWDPASPHRPRGSSLAVSPRSVGRGPMVSKVFLVCAYGDATARAVGRMMPESISPRAFGPAEQLNREIGWGLVAPGHDGTYVAFAGPRLRAHDHATAGTVLEWLPDLSNPSHAKAVRMIEDGAGCSVLMKILERGTLPLSRPIEVVRRARLVNVAITTRPAYAGAVGKVFRSSWTNDADQLREQLEAVAREAQFRARATRGW